MKKPELIELSKVDFVTIDTIGPPGKRVFYLQAAQDDLLVTLIIEKEHAAALSIAIQGLLLQLGETKELPVYVASELVQPVRPLFRVGRLGLGYDETDDMVVITAEELVTEGDRQGARVNIWGTRAQMAALARKAAIVVASGRPLCPLCHEPLNPGERHVCTKGNGRRGISGTGETQR